MKRGVIFILFLCGFISANAQESLHKHLSDVWDLLNELKIEEAYTIVNRIENTCINSHNDTILANFFWSKGVCYFNQKKYKECIPLLDTARTLYERTNIRYHNYIDCFSLIGTAHTYLGNIKEAERYLRKAFIRCQSTEITDKNFTQVGLLINLSTIYEFQGDTITPQLILDFTDNNTKYIERKTKLLDSINLYRRENNHERAIKISSVLCNEIKENEGITDEYIMAEFTRATMLFSQGGYDQSKHIFKNIIYLTKRYGISNDYIDETYLNYCICLAMDGEYIQVDSIIHTLIGYYQSQSKINKISIFYSFVGSVAFSKGDYPNTIKYFENYIKYIKKREDDTNNQYDDVISGLGMAYISAGKIPQAITLLKNYLNKYEKIVSTSNPTKLISVYDCLGMAMLQNEQYKKAIKWFNQSKEIQIATTGEVSPYTTLYIDICTSKE